MGVIPYERSAQNTAELCEFRENRLSEKSHFTYRNKEILLVFFHTRYPIWVSFLMKDLHKILQGFVNFMKIGSVKSHTSHTGIKKFYRFCPHSLSYLSVIPYERSAQNTVEICEFHENRHLKSQTFLMGVSEFTCTSVPGKSVTF